MPVLLGLLLITGLALIAIRTYSKAAVGSSDAEITLSRICHGNEAQLESLIQHESKRNPKLSREQAIQDVLESIRRDNR